MFSLVLFSYCDRYFLSLVMMIFFWISILSSSLFNVEYWNSNFLGVTWGREPFRWVTDGRKENCANRTKSASWHEFTLWTEETRHSEDVVVNNAEYMDHRIIEPAPSEPYQHAPSESSPYSTHRKLLNCSDVEELQVSSWQIGNVQLSNSRISKSMWHLSHMYHT